MDEILHEVKRYEGYQKEIKHEIYKLCWFMRGSISLEEGFYLTHEDRTIISDIIKDNIETTKKTHIAFI